MRDVIGMRFIVALLLAFAVAGTPVAAQPVAKVARVGVIGERSAADPFVAAFQQGMLDLGYIEGRNVEIVVRHANGIVDRFPGLVAELIRLDVDVIVVGGGLAARAAKAATTRVPIVFTVVGDPVAAGLVSSLARPGGNVTGLSNLATELSAKQLELLKAALPTATRIAILHNPLNSGAALRRVREAARTLGVEVVALEVHQPSELPAAFASLSAQRASAVLALSDPVFGDEIRLATLALTHRLPALYSRGEFAKAGGMLAYGPSFVANYRRAATYVDKILKGTKPADIPVEQPTRFDFVVNLKTARALGLAIPGSLLQRATQIVE